METYKDSCLEIYKEISSYQNCTTYSFLLFHNKIAIYYLSFHIKNDTCFIDKLDSTGHSLKCKSKDFILTILSEYCKTCRIIYCFSLSKLVYVFRNENKKVLNDIKQYWIDIFRMYNDKANMFVLQFNSKNYLKDIYKSSKEIVRFNDDPVSKILENVGDLELDKLYEILSCRNDFMKGSLIYLVKNDKLIELNAVKESSLIGQDKIPHTCEVNTLEEQLLELSFNGEEDILESSKKLYDNLKTEKFFIKIFNRPEKTKKEESKTILKVKRRK
ncbi:histone acetlytransferase RTT109 [Vairimorpha necatrix]|uniref:Histone acetlytransferase RTT109 n=1 Tax=Vairimorpha necatrix TaxID=6039 RepID=A0AAX4JCW1_9MICR